MTIDAIPLQQRTHLGLELPGQIRRKHATVTKQQDRCRE
jgi:hypothetical protein